MYPVGERAYHMYDKNCLYGIPLLAPIREVISKGVIPSRVRGEEALIQRASTRKNIFGFLSLECGGTHHSRLSSLTYQLI